MNSDTYSEPKLFIGDREVQTFSSIQFSEAGKSLASNLNCTVKDPHLRDAPLKNKEIKFFLNYGSEDTVPFFRGRIRQATPNETQVQIVAYDVRTLLTGKESIPLSLTDKNNYDGYTLAQFLHEYISEYVNVTETVIGLDMLNETNPVVSLSGVRGNKLNALKIVTDRLPKNQDDLTEIKNNRLSIIDDGNKSNIVFIKEQDLDSAAIRFSYSDGIDKLSVKKRPAPNLLSTKVDDVNVIYKHNNLTTGVQGGQIEGKFSHPDEAKQAAFVQANYAEIDSEITIQTTKGHYLNIGNVVFLNVREYPNETGKHRIVSKQVTCTDSGVTCTLQLAKERPQLSEYLSS
tara:strand:+ start:701 stop:1735 length:1035 start_codon:yes stop_codon:yes gene_type:complete